MLTIKDAIIKFANKASNAFASYSYPKGSVASMSFVITSKGDVSYASFEDGGKINKNDSVHVSSGSTIQIINRINISEFSLNVLDSWRYDKIIPKTEILKSIGLKTEFYSGTVASIFGTFLHELTHVANFHVYTDSFKALVNMYLDNRVAAYSIVSESFADQSLAVSLMSRFEKSPEVFYLYPYNNFVRGWAETEAGAAGYVGTYVFGLFYMKALSILIKNIAKTFAFRYSQLTQGGLEQNVLESINPIALMFKRIFYRMVANNVTEDSLIENIINDFTQYKETLADVIYSVISSDRQELEHGEVSFNSIREALASIFINRYGFDRACKVSFATDEGNSLYEDFVELVVTSVTSDFVYYLMSALTQDYKEEIIQALKVCKYEIEEGLTKNNKDAIIEQVKNKVVAVFFSLFAIAAYYNIRDLSGDILLSADYIIAWVSRMKEYIDRIMNLAGNLDDLWSTLFGEEYKNSEFNIIKHSIFTGADKTESYNLIVAALKAIYKSFGAPEEYVDSCLETRSLKKFESTLDLPASLFVAINTFTEVYPITGSDESMSNLISVSSSFTYNVKSDFYGYKFAKNNNIANIANKYVSVIKNNKNIRYITGIFLLVNYICAEAANWAYNILYRSKLTPQDIEGMYREYDNIKFLTEIEAKQFYNKIVGHLSEYFEAFKTIKLSFSSSIKKTITAISKHTMTKNVSAFDRLVDYIFPANFSDMLAIYKSTGTQMRIIEFTNEFVKTIFNDSSLNTLIKKKVELIEKYNEKRSSEKYKDELEEVQKQIDAIIRNIVKSFVHDIHSKELWDFMKEKYGELDVEEEGQNTEKEENNEEKHKRITKEQLIEAILRLIHNNNSMQKIIGFINTSFSSEWETAYNKILKENPMPVSKKDYKDAYDRAKSIIDGLRLIPSQTEVLEIINKDGYEGIERMRNQIGKKSEDLVQVFDLIVNSVQLKHK